MLWVVTSHNTALYHGTLRKGDLSTPFRPYLLFHAVRGRGFSTGFEMEDIRSQLRPKNRTPNCARASKAAMLTLTSRTPCIKTMEPNKPAFGQKRRRAISKK